ncbi:MAG TPA: hypothetical protein VFA79_00455 [Myxococcales bacterium]|nr:hypothetical protein [Myxococcales bacterium]
MSAAVLLALALSAEPTFIRLGADTRAVLRIDGEAQPSISASVGRIGPLRRRDGGGWEADYLPPDDALPQVALILAVSGDEVTWTAVPLWGEGDAVVKTRPRGRISVEIGTQTYGPAIADEHGEAVVPVLVPPGILEAHHGKRIIPLHVPPSRTVHVALGAAAPAADRAQTVAVYVAASNARGEPRQGAAIRLSATRGTLSAAHERAPGLYEAWLALEPGPPVELRVTAALDDAPAFVAETKLALGGGPARTIRISADRERIDPDDPVAKLHVSARDAAGNAPGDVVRFESTTGQVSPEPTGPGEWDLKLAVAPSFAGRDSVEVRASTANASAAKSLRLVPGPPRTVEFEKASASLVADGKSRLRLRVQLLDGHGNAIHGVRPELSAGQGSAELEESDGALYASYLPPVLHRGGDTTLALRAGALEGRANLRLLPDLRRAAVGAKAGVLSNLSGFSVPLIGVEASLRSAALGPELALSLGAEYGHRAQSELLQAGASQLNAESRIDLALVHLSATLRRPFGERNTLWVGGGPCAAAYWSRVGAAGTPERRGFAIAPGLEATFGAERRFHWGVPFAEARAAWITSPGLPILTGPLRTVALMAGVRLETL